MPQIPPIPSPFTSRPVGGTVTPGQTLCPRCNNAHETGDQFCMHCGAQLVAQVRRCGKCGAYPDASDRYCIFCGETLASTPTPVTA
jgi:predicted amidophosphoribosyltransferase